MSIFGIPEMKDFAEEHEDPRVVAIWLRLEESRKKNAEWCDEAIRLISKGLFEEWTNEETEKEGVTGEL